MVLQHPIAMKPYGGALSLQGQNTAASQGSGGAREVMGGTGQPGG